MRAFARCDDLEHVVGAHQRPGAHREAPHRHARPVVHAVDRAHREAIEETFLDHHAPAALVLLGWLKDEVDGSIDTLRPRQRAGGAEQHGGVPVMAAGVHPAFVP